MRKLTQTDLNKLKLVYRYEFSLIEGNSYYAVAYTDNIPHYLLFNSYGILDNSFEYVVRLNNDRLLGIDKYNSIHFLSNEVMTNTCLIKLITHFQAKDLILITTGDIHQHIITNKGKKVEIVDYIKFAKIAYLGNNQYGLVQAFNNITYSASMDIISFENDILKHIKSDVRIDFEFEKEYGVCLENLANGDKSEFNLKKKIRWLLWEN